MGDLIHPGIAHADPRDLVIVDEARLLLDTAAPRNSSCVFRLRKRTIHCAVDLRQLAAVEAPVGLFFPSSFLALIATNLHSTLLAFEHLDFVRRAMD